MAPDKGGLSQAQDRIAGLMDELDRTLDLVNRLSEHGEERAAIRLLEGQRRELYRAIEDISVGVGVRHGRFERARRNITTLVAAAALAMTGLAAVSASVIMRQTPNEGPVAELDRAAGIPDVTERLKVVIRVYERTTPAERRVIASDLRAALEESIEDAKGDDGTSEELIDQAEAAVSDLNQPDQPPAAPGNDQGPVDSVRDLLPEP